MAAKVLIVKVTRKHIKQGERGDSHKCPLALASGGAVGQWAGIRIGAATYIHSQNSRDFVRAFDDGRPVKPATFRLKRMFS